MKYLSKPLLAITIIFSTTGNALQSSDYQCVSDCTSRGYMYQLCQSKCSYDSAGVQQPASTDYNCVNDCTSKGQMYQYCQEKCSY